MSSAHHHCHHRSDTRHAGRVRAVHSVAAAANAMQGLNRDFNYISPSMRPMHPEIPQKHFRPEKQGTLMMALQLECQHTKMVHRNALNVVTSHACRRWGIAYHPNWLSGWVQSVPKTFFTNGSQIERIAKACPTELTWAQALCVSHHHPAGLCPSSLEMLKA
jgi:hypothetical protein